MDMASTRDEEAWCLQQWLECRRDAGLPELVPVTDAPKDFRGDALFSEKSGIVGVEITRVIDGELAARETAAWNFIRADLATILENHLSGVVYAHPDIHEEWHLPQEARSAVAAEVSSRILTALPSLTIGGRLADVSVPPYVRMRISLGGRQEPRLALGATWVGMGWQGGFDDDAAKRIIEAIATKRRKGQLEHPIVTRRVLLLHNRMAGLDRSAVHQAIEKSALGDLHAFDEITLVSTWEPGECILGWMKH